MEAIVVVLVAGVALAIFATTPKARAWLARFGLDGRIRGGTPREDREYLLRVSGGDATRVQERLDAERAANSDLSEKEAHRRAIRTAMRDRRDRIFEDVDLGEEADGHPGSAAREDSGG